MSVLQTIDLKKYYGAEPNITRALDGVNPDFTGERHMFHYTFLFDAYVSCHRVKNRKFLWYNSVDAFALAGTVFCRSNRKQRKG